MKEVVTYGKGEFVDYLGETHPFIVAAVSTTDITEEGQSLWLSLYDEYGPLDEEPLNKALFIGVAICNPKDEFDEEKGKAIAYNKAVNAKSLHHPAMFSTRPGYINTDVVNALVNNIINYIKKDPGSVIAGYDIARKKYLKKIEDDKFVENSSKELVNLANAVKGLSKEEKKDLDKLINIL